MNKRETSGGQSFTRRMLYCQGCLGQNVINLAVVTWAIYFYAPPEGAGTALISVGIAGILMGIGRFLDVISDPLIGYWSDNATYASGRRRPFIFWGAPLTAIFFFLIWMPPVGRNSIWNAVWLFLIVNGYFTALTIAGVPYRSVIPDIADTSKERLAISMGMALFGSVGALLGAGTTGPVIQSFGYVPMGLILGIIGWASFWLALKGVKERPRSAVDLGTKLSIFGAVRETLKNREFLAFAASIVSFQIGFQMFMIIMPYFVRVILGRPEAQVAIFQGSFVLVMMASLPFWLWAGTRIGKRRGQLLALLLLAVLFPLFYFIGFLPVLDPFWQTLVYFCVVAVPVSGLYVFPNAIVGDITDYDEKITRKRREAMYYGGFGFVEKSAWAASAFLVGLLLDRLGYTAANPLGIRLAGPIAGVVALLGFLAFRSYSLPDVTGGPGEKLQAQEDTA
jgi:glycoside/pentoside/hexuronide:cation symporter, GPH family